MKKITAVLFVVIAASLFFNNPVLSAYKLDKSNLSKELTTAGYQITKEVDFFGIPCFEIILPWDQAIYQVCRNIPLLNAHYFEAREAIAIVNGLNMFYSRSNRGNPYDTVRKQILIPLDTSISPKAFPEYDQKLACYSKFILVDRAKQLMGYYEQGHLVACFPVSTGRPGKGTPAIEGWITFRDENHISSIYDVLMPFSLHLTGPYFLHAGVMPGKPDSAGCIRIFTEHAQWLFQRVGSSRTRFKVV